MNLEKLYWRQDGLFDSSFIKKVKELAGQQKLKDLQLQDKNRELLTRDSKGCFINSTWLQTQLAPVINDTNKTLGWNFKLSKFEDLQYTSYDKSQHYSWHTDTHAKPYADGMVRKISFSLILNDEFEGGDFAICEPHPQQGDGEGSSRVIWEEIGMGKYVGWCEQCEGVVENNRNWWW